MKISRIDLWLVRYPLPAPFMPAWIPGFLQTENHFTLVRLTTADGIEGYSAVQSMSGELAGLGGLLGSYLLGECGSPAVLPPPGTSFARSRWRAPSTAPTPGPMASV